MAISNIIFLHIMKNPFLINVIVLGNDGVE